MTRQIADEVVPATLDTQIPKSLGTTAGDLLLFDGTNWVRQGKGAAYQTLRVKPDGSTLEYASPSRIAATLTASATANNTAAETDLGQLAVPTTVGVNDLLRATFIGDLFNNTGASVTFRWRIYLGATIVCDSASLSITTGTLRRGPWEWTAQVLVVNPASAQRGLGSGEVDIGVINAGGTAANLTARYRATAAENLTAAKTLKCTVTMNTANALAEVVRYEAFLEVIKAGV